MTGKVSPDLAGHPIGELPAASLVPVRVPAPGPVSAPFPAAAAATAPGAEHAPARAALRAPRGGRVGRWGRLLAVLGPGVMVMLADTDAGSVVTAAQSGSRYGYRLLACQLALIPVLYLVQETTARLGLVTGQGHGALIRQHFGARWGLLSAGTLFVACTGALVTEFAGLAGVGSLLGIPRAVSVGVPALALIVLLLLGRYRRIEHVGIAIGALELLFIPAALAAHPRSGAIVDGLVHPISAAPGYLTLLAANVGAVIMPWMIFYQQEAVIDRSGRAVDLRRSLRQARLDTLIGSVVTQAVMIAVLVSVAATIGRSSPGRSLTDITQISAGLTPFLGRTSAVLFFGLGMVGAATVAALVVALAGAWGMSEVLGWRHSLNDSPRAAIGFYGLAIAGTGTGALVALLAPNLVNLSVDIEVLNACMLPVVLGFLLALERSALPPELRARGLHRVASYALTGLVIALGLVTAVQAARMGWTGAR